jgi:hypothetical protein
MDGRRAIGLARVWDNPPRIRRHEPRALPRPCAWALALVWPVLYIAMVAIAPEPADPNAVPTLLDSFVFMAFMVGLIGTTAAAFTRHGTALVWSTGLGALWVATAVACPLSGHHSAMDWQWRLELALSGALLLLSVIGWRLLRTR